MTDETEIEDAPEAEVRTCISCDREYELNADGDTPDTDWHAIDADGDESVCSRCIGRNYTHSAIHDYAIRTLDAVYIESENAYCTLEHALNNYYQHSSGDWYAEPEEEEEEEEEDACLLDYGDDVLDHCMWDARAARRGALLFGVELEMEPTSRASQSEVAEALGGRVCDQYILKSDGSLECGVELVTVPLTLDGHRTAFNWESVLKPVLRKAKSGAGTTRCGMHVHINKAALSAFTIGKMLVFLNSPCLEELVTTIAQRASNGYCTRSKKKITDGRTNGHNRYDIANVNDRTVELRLFRGNLRPERVLKNIEFCHAVVNYCRDASMVTLENPEIFAQWLRKRRGEYPELVKFLAAANASFFSGMIRPRKDQPVTVIEEV